MKRALISLIVLIILGAVVYAYRDSPWLAPLLGSQTQTGSQQIKQVTFSCDGGKTITATFYNSTSTTQAAPGEPPVPTGSVALVLSDGRSMTLPQALSASGARYVSADGSFVFWTEGETAFTTEGTSTNAPITYSGCIAVSNISGQEGWNTFASSTLGFSIRYPQGYTVEPNYQYTLLGPGKTINGVKFIVSPAMASGTNLSSYDSGVSIEQLPNLPQCTPEPFLDNVQSTSTLVDNGTTYLVAQGGGAGAGNFYQEVVYALPGTNPCTAVRYFIHSTDIGNYTPGTVQAFDQAALLSQFDGIRRSLILGQ